MARVHDLVVIGAGVFGLWTALAAARRGHEVLVVDQAGPGGGASGGVIGALAPHVPERWNPKKQFQLEALVTLGDAIAAAEDAGGLRAGYGRIGRLQPMADATQAARAAGRAAGAAQLWPAGLKMELLPPDAAPGWVDPVAAGGGILHDTLTARLDPAATCRMLAAALTATGGALRLARVRGVTPGRVETDAGPLRARRIVVAAGEGSFALVAPLLGRATGGAEKGQAALFDLPAPPRPLIYGNGVYVLPHATGGIAVGATSEKRFDDAPGRAPGTDAQLDAVIARAATLCPVLRGARPVRRWAGLRPRAAGRDPMLGALPGAPDILMATGGFKISFGIGHRVGEEVAAMLDGEPGAIPDSFRVSFHLR